MRNSSTISCRLRLCSSQSRRLGRRGWTSTVRRLASEQAFILFAADDQQRLRWPNPKAEHRRQGALRSGTQSVYSSQMVRSSLECPETCAGDVYVRQKRNVYGAKRPGVQGGSQPSGPGPGGRGWGSEPRASLAGEDSRNRSSPPTNDSQFQKSAPACLWQKVWQWAADGSPKTRASVTFIPHKTARRTGAISFEAPL